jgi:hypothetical protein
VPAADFAWAPPASWTGTSKAGQPATRKLVASAGEGRYWRLHQHSEIEIKAGCFTGRYTSTLHFECLGRNRSVASFKFGPSRGGLWLKVGCLRSFYPCFDDYPRPRTLHFALHFEFHEVEA